MRKPNTFMNALMSSVIKDFTRKVESTKKKMPLKVKNSINLTINFVKMLPKQIELNVNGKFKNKGRIFNTVLEDRSQRITICVL